MNFTIMQAGKHRLFLNILLFGKLPCICQVYVITLSLDNSSSHSRRIIQTKSRRKEFTPPQNKQNPVEHKQNPVQNKQNLD